MIPFLAFLIALFHLGWFLLPILAGIAIWRGHARRIAINSRGSVSLSAGIGGRRRSRRPSRLRIPRF